MKVISLYKNRLKYSENAFREAVLLGFFIGLGLSLNVVSLPESKHAGMVAMTILVGFIFWGIGVNLIAFFLSSLFSALLQAYSKTKIDKDKIFLVLIWSHLPFVLAILSGLIRMVNPKLAISEYALIFLEVFSLVLLIGTAIGQLKKSRING